MTASQQCHGQQEHAFCPCRNALLALLACWPAGRPRGERELKALLAVTYLGAPGGVAGLGVTGHLIRSAGTGHGSSGLGRTLVLGLWVMSLGSFETGGRLHCRHAGNLNGRGAWRAQTSRSRQTDGQRRWQPTGKAAYMHWQGEVVLSVGRTVGRTGWGTEVMAVSRG